MYWKYLVNLNSNSNDIDVYVVCLCADGGEEQTATGEAGACRAEAPADYEEGRNAAGGGGWTGPEDSSPH